MKSTIVYWIMASILAATIAGFTATVYFDKSVDLPVTPLSDMLDPTAKPHNSQLIYGGFGSESLNKPMDVSLIGQFLYVTDTNNKRVQVFDLGGNPIFKFGEEGTGPGQFKFPYGISGDQQGQVYVADMYNGCISVHDSRGNFLRYFAEQDPKEKLIEAPGGLRIYDDKLYVTDIQKSKAYVFSLDGKLLLEIGEPGTNPGQLRAPNAVTIDRDGNIYVVDSGNQRVQVYDSTGKFIKILSGAADGQNGSIFVNPRGIGIDSRGVIYVVSNLTHYVYGFDKDGKQLFGFGGNGEENEQFSLPNGLFIDESDQVYITDTMNQRIAIFR